MVMGTGVKTAMSAWMFFKRVLMIAITVVRLLCGLAVFRRVRVVWVVVEVVCVDRGYVPYPLGTVIPAPVSNLTSLSRNLTFLSRN